MVIRLLQVTVGDKPHFVNPQVAGHGASSSPRWHAAAYRPLHHSGVSQRRNMSVRLTPEARDAWEALCTRRGVTATTLLEQLGLLLAEIDWVPEEAIVRARAMDRARYSRRANT